MGRKRRAGSVGDDSSGASWGQLRLEPLRRQPSLLPQPQTGSHAYRQATVRTPPLRSPFNHRGALSITARSSGVAGRLRLRRLRNWKNVGTAPRWRELIWHREIADTTLQIVSFGIDHNDEMLIVDLARGIYQLERKPESTEKFPIRLSETGMFTSVKEHQTDSGLIPYSVNAPLWTDGAHVERFIALPCNSQIEMSTADGVGWSFPNGTALIQTFALDLEVGNPTSRHRIETRLLTRQQGEWVGYSYIWNDDQTDATLVDTAGTDRTFTIQDSSVPEGSREQSWHYPSREECMSCHSRAANYVLGLTTLQMNKVHNYGTVADNQLRTLNHIGVFKKPLSKSPEEYSKLVNPYNPKEPLEARARSYLHAACANCHVHTGGGNARIVLDFTTGLDKTYSVDFRPQHDTYGIPNAMLIAPGDPERSILYQRVARHGEGKMPPLATSQQDLQAAQLLYHWISQMKSTPR